MYRHTRDIQNKYLIMPELFSSSYMDEDARRIKQQRCEIASAVGSSGGAGPWGPGNKYRGVLLVVPMGREASDRTRNQQLSFPTTF